MTVETRCTAVVQDIDAGPADGRITNIEALEISASELSPGWNIRSDLDFGGGPMLTSEYFLKR